MNPEKLNKYLYIKRTPTWLVRSVYAFGIASWILVVYGFSRAIAVDPFYQWFVMPLLAFFALYHFTSFGLNLFYRQFDLKKHDALIKRYWLGRSEPSVDIFLPICGEELPVLRRTWEHVAKIEFANKRVYVLDNSKTGCAQHKAMAEEFGFAYFERPNKGEMKKAGNLKYAYERTSGEFIVIFDADFAPRSDFLYELLPYMDDPRVGIAQSPQYFESSHDVHKRSPIEYGAVYAEEPFYRFIQVTRDRFGGAICCGSNAIYRRAALQDIGGPVQMEFSEDAHTGFAMTCRDWIVRYVPVILAVGLCPDNAHAYFHQQHRWCMGSMALMLSRKFWLSPVSWKAKFCYITGFQFYLSHPLVIVFSFQLFWTLFFYNPYISLSGSMLFYPHLVFAVLYLVFFPIPRFRWGYLYALLLQTYSYSHAVFTALLRSSVGWVPTNAKHTGASLAYRQTVVAVCVYVLAYALLVAYGARTGMIHVFNYHYLSIQFWLFYNLILPWVLLWQMYRTMEQMQKSRVADGAITRGSLMAWQFKTAGAYITIATGVFLLVVFA